MLRFRLFSLLGIIIALLLCSGCDDGPEKIPVAPPHINAPGSTLPWQGRSSYWLGANYAWYNYGTDFGAGGWGKITDWKRIDHDFATMHAQGVHVVRWWVFADGRYEPLFKNNEVSGLDPTFLPDIDKALEIAARHKMYLMLTLMDSSMWGPATTKGKVTMGGHGSIVLLTGSQQNFLDRALKPLLVHIAANPNHTQIAAYDIVNEPELQMHSLWATGAGISAGAVKSFVSTCAAYIHTYSGGSLVTVGSATPYFVTNWKNTGLDFYQLHYYPKMDEKEVLGVVYVPGNGLPSYASLHLDKPCIVGEFATMDSGYGLTDKTPLSARWYLDNIQKKGYAGALGWSYAVKDNASHWNTFAPVLTQWSQEHHAQIGP